VAAHFVFAEVEAGSDVEVTFAGEDIDQKPHVVSIELELSL
jgi:hypothetical protein